MKNFFEKVSSLGCLLPFILGAVFPFVIMFIKVWDACNGNILSFIINIIAIPLVFIGGINIIRGFCKVLEKDTQNFDIKKYWHFAIYFIISIAGYIAVVLAIAQFVNI